MSELPIVTRLRMHRVVLKSGEFDGAQLMQAWCDMIQAADEIERLHAALVTQLERSELLRLAAIEECAGLADDFAYSRPLTVHDNNQIIRGRYDGEQNAAKHIAKAIRDLAKSPMTPAPQGDR